MSQAYIPAGLVECKRISWFPKMLYVLLTMNEERGHICRLTLDEMALKATSGERAVERALDDLEREGFIRRLEPGTTLLLQPHREHSNGN